MVFFLFIANYSSVVEPSEQVALLVDNQAAMDIMHLAVYVIFGTFLLG